MVLNDQPDDARVLRDAARTIREDGEALWRSLRRIALLELKRLQLKAVDASFAVLLGLCAFLSLVAICIAGAVSLVAGLRTLLARWMGSGAPELVTGVLVLGIAFALLFGLRAWTRRQLFRSAAQRLEMLGAPTAAPSPIPPSGQPAQPNGTST